MTQENDKNIQEYLKSYWILSTPETNYPSLTEDIKVDVAIIGGGIVGINVAYLLKKQGIKVAILEASRIIQGATGFTTAKITSQHHLIYHKIINSMGLDFAREYADANQSSIEFINEMIKELNIECDFERVPAYMYTNSDNYISKIEKEAEAALKVGIKSNCVDKLPLDLNIKKALVFENQAQFHPRKYLLPIAQKIPGDGSYIFENTRVMEVEKGNLVTVITSNGKKVKAPKVIIASHFPCYDGMGLYLARLRPQRSYVIAANIKEKFPKGMFINAEDPGRSLRSQTDGENQLVLIGGEGHKTAHGESSYKHYDNLKEFAESIFNVNSILYKWSTQDYITIDNVPYVGKITSSEENIYVATGFAEWGMTNGVAAARILADKILGRDNPWKEVFNPSRTFTQNAYKNLFSENFDVAKELIIGKIKAGENGIHIEAGEGKIVTLNGTKYGAYKDYDDILHIVDITCTHVGCELKWNDVEKSWDCPCHGSRFNYDGEILEGPATHKLNHYKEGKNKIDLNL
ncbi:Glycine/D-amino acid oxidase [Clostridium cavendishii DSM 21758]|uniref:Glycine/D-amino acid oxidase n=1 Tax=Clostridium cavendishii DSM 21758 TaxID=1121302 RepID=A0A1M6N7R0_9CLOT|nr:FAD-dependent oxidoreductase [Clostridium cavendishii]SHJ91775.1 Glycine/D-amino acid oxidase [Clostridium cavendishii DSM 21758]